MDLQDITEHDLSIINPKDITLESILEVTKDKYVLKGDILLYNAWSIDIRECTGSHYTCAAIETKYGNISDITFENLEDAPIVGFDEKDIHTGIPFKDSAWETDGGSVRNGSKHRAYIICNKDDMECLIDYPYEPPQKGSIHIPSGNITLCTNKYALNRSKPIKCKQGEWRWEFGHHEDYISIHHIDSSPAIEGGTSIMTIENHDMHELLIMDHEKVQKEYERAISEMNTSRYILYRKHMVKIGVYKPYRKILPVYGSYDEQGDLVSAYIRVKDKSKLREIANEIETLHIPSNPIE